MTLDGPVVFVVKDMGLGGLRRCVVTYGQGVDITVERNHDEIEKNYYINLALDDLEAIVKVGKALQ